MLSRYKSLLLLFLTCFTRSSWSAAKFYVNPDTNRIVDLHGRERIFHGDNVVQKTAPFIPITTHFDARYHRIVTMLSITLVCQVFLY